MQLLQKLSRQYYFATRSSHFTIESITIIDPAVAPTKTSQQDQIGTEVYKIPPMNSNELPIAVAASQPPCINPCRCGGATFDTKDNPRGEIKSSATVSMKYKPTITHGVTRILLISASDIEPKASLVGSTNEITIRKIYAKAAIPIPMAIFFGVDGSLPF